MESTIWTNINSFNSFESITHTKQNGKTQEINIGDCITYIGYPTSRPDGVKIIKFTYNESKPDIGPIGMIYLPWRKDEKRWASPAFSMRGAPRHIICYPIGRNNYGEHIDWESIEIIPNPEN